MSKILKLKSWHVFGVMIILPVLFVLFGVVISKLTGIMILSPLLSFFGVLIMMITYYGWIWVAGTVTHQQGGQDNPLKLNVFRILFLLALLFLVILTPILRTSLKAEDLFLADAVQLIAVVSFFYCIYFVSKSLRMIEEQRGLKSGYLFLDFFLIWILPIGIWVIQPRMNKVLSVEDK